MDRRSTAQSLLGLALASLALTACASPTELILVIDTNLEVPSELDSLDVAVTGPSSASRLVRQSLTDPAAPSFPMTLGITPSGDELGPVEIVVAGRVMGEVVVEQRIRTSLVSGESRVVHVVLSRACLGVTCVEGRSCGPRGCQPSGVDGEDLPRYEGELPTFDPDDPCLIDPWDPDGDGHGNPACGGDDCDNGASNVYPGALEDCDGVDNDCDGVADPDCGCAPVDTVGDCETSCGTTGTRRCVLEMGSSQTRWTPCTLPDEICNQIDDDCNGSIDDGLPLTPGTPMQISTGGKGRDPEVVWAGDRWTVFFQDDVTEDGIHMAHLDPTGAPMGPPVLVADAGEVPGAIWDGDRYLLLYTDPYSDSYCCETDAAGTCVSTCNRTLRELELSALMRDGTSIFTDVHIDGSIDANMAPSFLVGDGGLTLAYCDGDPQLERVSALDGSERGRRRRPFDNGECPFAMVWDGLEYWGVAADNEDLVFTRGPWEMWPNNDTTLFTGDNAPDVDELRMVQTPMGWLVAFTADQGLAVASLDPSTPTLSSPAIIAMDASRSSREPLDLAAGGDTELLVWVRDVEGAPREVVFAQLNASGAVIGGPTPVHTSTLDSVHPDIAWSGTRYGVAWSEDEDSVWFTTVSCE